jgi:iron complex outermembrane receptor protein
MFNSGSGWLRAVFVVMLIAGIAFCPQKGIAQTDQSGPKETAVTPASSSQQESAAESRENENRVFTLGEIEVVSRGEETKNTTLDKVYYDEMRLFDRNNLADAVDLLPGVTLSETGARGEFMAYVRGFDLKHVPIFLDGIPIYVPYDGYPDLARFTTFDLSEVVVSKGFTSVLYGPNTMGGAINMVSRRPVKNIEMNLGTGYGSGNSYNGFGNIGTNQGKWYLQIGGSYLNSDYFRVSNDLRNAATQAGDGARRVNSYNIDWKASAKIGYTPNSTDEYVFNYINQQAEKGVPPYAGYDSRTMARFWQWPYWNKESFYFNSKTAILDSSYVKTRLFYDIFQNSLYSYDDETYTTMLKKSSFKSSYDDYTYGGSIETGTLLLPYNSLKAAFHFKKDVHREINKEGNPTQRFEDDVFSVGLEDTIDFTQKVYGIAGVSYDWVNSVEAQDLNANNTLVSFPTDNAGGLNPQGGLFYKFTDTGTFHGSIAQKTRLPSIKDKYSYRLGQAIPNPDLKPEKSINYEFGYKDILFKNLMLEANLFYSQVTDFILFKTVQDPTNPKKTTNQNQNIGKVNQYGLELGLSGKILECLKGGFNYTYLQYQNASTTDQMVNLPNHKLFAYLQYFTPLKGLSLVGSVEYNSDRYSSTDTVRVVDQYTLVNIKAIYDILYGFSIEGGINNLSDENYALDEGYPLAGRNYFVNLRYTF